LLNTRANLRIATNAQNQHNSRQRSDNTSGTKGVSWYKRDRKWQAKIKVDRKLYHLGFFSRIEDAAAAYARASQELHGEFSCLG